MSGRDEHTGEFSNVYTQMQRRVNHCNLGGERVWCLIEVAVVIPCSFWMKSMWWLWSLLEVAAVILCSGWRESVVVFFAGMAVVHTGQ